jgi:uncharacterized protein YecT (DUF1311 family)
MQLVKRFGLVTALSLLLVQGALAQNAQRVADGLCDGRRMAPRDYTECLRKAQEDSDRAMRDRIAAIVGTIDKTPNMQAQQRNRWKKALDDSQALWVRFRNGECQEMTPFETTNKTRIAEEQRICILEYNQRRMGELKQRYPAVGS